MKRAPLLRGLRFQSNDFSCCWAGYYQGQLLFAIERLVQPRSPSCCYLFHSEIKRGRHQPQLPLIALCPTVADAKERAERHVPELVQLAMALR